MSNGEWTERPDLLAEKSLAFAIRIVRLSQHVEVRRQFLLSKQILRSGTAGGAMVREGKYAQSPADFVNKLSIALKEASETAYWLLLLQYTGYLSEDTRLVRLKTTALNFFAF